MKADLINYCLHCGTALVPQLHTGKYRPTCPNCGWIYFPDPKVAVAVLIRQDDQVLLVKRKYDPHRGEWSLPAGFIDAGEDPKQAAERECLEETGLSVHITQLLDVVAGQEHPRGAHILIVYQAEVISGVLRPADDAEEVSFYSYQDLPPLAFSSTKRILKEHF